MIKLKPQKIKAKRAVIRLADIIQTLSVSAIMLELLFVLTGMFDTTTTQAMVEHEPQVQEMQMTPIDQIPYIILTPTPAESGLDTARAFITKNFPDSPLIDRINLFEQGDLRKSKLALAIAGVESGFGTKGFIATNCHNAWGYLYPGTTLRGCYGQSWISWDTSIPRYMAVADNWLSMYDGTPESLSGFTGKGGYCQSACGEYQKSLLYFLAQFDEKEI